MPPGKRRRADFTRQVIDIPGEADFFEHDHILSEQVAGRFVATCRTERPALRCSCFFYDLAWEPKVPQGGIVPDA